MSLSDGFEVFSSDATELVGFRSNRGPYLKKAKPNWDFTNGHVDGFMVLDEAQTEDDFRIEAPGSFEKLPNYTKHSGHEKSFRIASSRPVCFIDGEGANHGEPLVKLRANGLTRSLQFQNYALLAATLEPAECELDCNSCSAYKYLIGENNHEQIPSNQCLDFIIGLPNSHIIVGYGLSYDVEHWLKDVPAAKMLELKKTGTVWWRRYLLRYIPNKVFSVSKWRKKRKIGSNTVYDIVGFFQAEFKSAIRTWNVGTQAEWEFIDRMKDARPGFGDVTDETLAYNHMEGKHGIQLFRRVREEYTRLELRVQRPVGAGSIASAMFRKHRIDNYFPVFQPVPVEVMLQSYIGGRFDVARIGFIGNVYEYDINSAYPHIARTLPCLAHSKFAWTDTYVPDRHSLWLVRWRDNENRWAPFPYRTPNGEHIRYYSSGTGYYYGSEVASALQLDNDIDIIGGYQLICECDERPFQWIEDYYSIRQEMKAKGDYAELIIKLGLNSVYGKLAQSKGKTPPWQNFIWAGMITSGTRAMLMQAVAQNSAAVFKLSTDAVFSTVPLQLDFGNELGQWKSIELEDLLVLGNGIYHSADGHVTKNRGYMKSDKYFNWSEIRVNYANHIESVVTKHEFMKFNGAYHGNRMEERCAWVDEQQFVGFDIPSDKVMRDNWIWPGTNDTPLVMSAPMRIDEQNLRKWE